MMAKGIIQVKESIARYKYTLSKSKKVADAWAGMKANEDLQGVLDDLDFQDRLRQAERAIQPVPIPAPPLEQFNVADFRAQLRRDAERREQRARANLIQPPPAAPRPPRNPR